MKKLLYFILIVLGLGMYSCADEPNLVIPDKDEAPGGNTDDNDGDGTGDGDVTDEGSDIEFTEEQLKLTNKRGIYLTPAQRTIIESLENITLNTNLGWVYNMCDEKSHSYGVECVNFVKSDIDQAGVDNLSKLIADGNCKRIMAFEVPYDLTDDAAIQASVDAAITKWVSLQALKVPMGSPCIDLTKAEQKWFKAFMAKIAELEYRVNYLCVKYNGVADIDVLKTAINNVKEYELPILVTGFAVVNAEETTDSDVLSFMKNSISFMESDSDIYGYAWTSFDADDSTAGVSALLNESGLTDLGNYYIKNIDNVEYGDNLVPTPGFETGLDDTYWTWTKGSDTTNDTNQIISGERTCRMKGTNNKIETINYIEVEKGKKYVFGYTARAQNSYGAAGGAWSKAYVSFALVNESGEIIVQTEKYQSSENKHMGGEVILDVDKVKIRIFTGWGLDCVAYVDDIYLQEVK